MNLVKVSKKAQLLVNTTIDVYNIPDQKPYYKVRANSAGCHFNVNAPLTSQNNAIDVIMPFYKDMPIGKSMVISVVFPSVPSGGSLHIHQIINGEVVNVYGQDSSGDPVGLNPTSLNAVHLVWLGVHVGWRHCAIGSMYTQFPIDGEGASWNDNFGSGDLGLGITLL